MAEPPPLLGEIDSDAPDPSRALARMVPFGIFTAPFNITGQPAMSVPTWTWTEGHLPIGVQLVAAPGREDLLLQSGRPAGAGTAVDNPDTWDLCRECQPRYVTPLPRRERRE